MKQKSNFSLFLRYVLQKYKLFILLNLILFIILMISLNLNIFEVSYNFKNGEIAPFSVIANRSLEYVDSLQTEAKKQAEKKSVSPVLDLNMTLYEEKVLQLNHWISLLYKEDLTLEERRQEIFSQIHHLAKEKKIDSLDFNGVVKILQKKGDLERFKSLLYSLYQEGIYQAVKGEGYHLEEYSSRMMPCRIIEKNEVIEDFRNFRKFIYADISYFDFYSLLGQKLGNKKGLKAITDLAYVLLEDNLYINTLYTEKEITTRLNRIYPVIKTIKEDEVIVRRGDKINQEILDKVKALKVFNRKNFLRTAIFTFCMALFFILSLNVALRLIAPQVFANLKKMTLVYIFMIANILIIYLFFNLLSFFSFPLGIIFPTGLTLYILFIIMESRVALTMNFAITIVYILFLLVYKQDSLYSIFYIFNTGIFTVLLSSNIYRRDQIIQNSLYTIFPYVILTALYLLFFQNYIESTHVGTAFLWSALNPVLSAVLAIGLIPAFEKMFNMITPFRLMELSNLGNPILSDLHLLAPGTYQHSLLVAHLAETACKEIGANSLLARVGALYHDIGKLTSPKYFAENMAAYQNSIHEEISPQLSAKILKGHILEGIKMGKEIGLPNEVLNFIPEHHGTAVIEFFYSKAKELQNEKSVDIDEPVFRYGGPNPQSKETAIVMLADGIEAGVRSLKVKRHDLIEEKIAQLIFKRVSQEALSESPLTLKELKKVQEVFTEQMLAYYHVRPLYPADKEKEEENKSHDM